MLVFTREFRKYLSRSAVLSRSAELSEDADAAVTAFSSADTLPAGVLLWVQPHKSNAAVINAAALFNFFIAFFLSCYLIMETLYHKPVVFSIHIGVFFVFAVMCGKIFLTVANLRKIWYNPYKPHKRK